MITRRTVERIATAFALGTPLDWSGPASRGEQGDVHRLRTERGEWAVKRSFAPVEEADVTDSTAFASTAAGVGVPTPAACRTADGAVLVATDEGPLRVHAWVDLAEVDPWLDPAAVGQLVAALHGCGFRGRSGVHPWYSEPVGEARWRQLADALAAAAAPFAADLAALLPEILALETLLEPPDTLLTCHRDLFADNLRRTTSGGLCVIDWDNAGDADPTHELAMVLYDIGCGEPARTRRLYTAYRDAGGPAELVRPGQFSMVIAALGHINERACARWLAAPPGDPERDRMAGLFGEFLDRPVTVESIDRTLAALA
ncbi:MAG: aminoglycoside phosphotransferase family protein [Nakamurella sp.]